jgi:hypothetical protein
MNKICTSIEQSQKLIELEIDVNTADMFWLITDKPRLHILVEDLEKYSRWDCIPAWSLIALISILPQSIEFKGNNYYLRFMKEYVEYANDEVSITGRCLHTIGNNLIDTCYEMILKLHEHKML